MKNRIILIILTLLTLLFMTGCGISNTIYLEINSRGLVSAESGAHFRGSTLDIPEKINGTYVTGIAQNGFRYASGMSGMRITLPEGVKTIGSNAFYGTGAVFPDLDLTKVESVAYDAFNDCAITRLTINSNITKYTPCWLRGTTEVKELVLEEGTEVLYSIIDTDRRKTLRLVSLPSTLTTVMADALSLCSSLEAIELPSSVTTIGDNAFKDTGVEIETLDLRNITSLGMTAFSGCTIGKLYVNDNITDYSSTWSEGIEGLNKLVVGKGMTKLTDFLSDGMRSTLKYVLIQEGVTEIDSSVFQNCTSLESVTLPSTLSKIGSYAFSGTNMVFDELDLTSVTYVGENAFDGCSVKSLKTGNTSSYATGWKKGLTVLKAEELD